MKHLASMFTRVHCALRRGDRKNGAIKFDKARFHISRGDKSQEGHLPGTRPTTSSFCSKSSSCGPAFSRSAASHCWFRSASPSAVHIVVPISCLIVDADAPQPALSIGRPRTHSFPPMALRLFWGWRSIYDCANHYSACASFTYYVTANRRVRQWVRMIVCVLQRCRLGDEVLINWAAFWKIKSVLFSPLHLNCLY